MANNVQFGAAVETKSRKNKGKNWKLKNIIWLTCIYRIWLWLHTGKNCTIHPNLGPWFHCHPHSIFVGGKVPNLDLLSAQVGPYRIRLFYQCTWISHAKIFNWEDHKTFALVKIKKRKNANSFVFSNYTLPTTMSQSHHHQCHQHEHNQNLSPHIQTSIHDTKSSPSSFKSLLTTKPLPTTISFYKVFSLLYIQLSKPHMEALLIRMRGK